MPKNNAPFQLLVSANMPHGGYVDIDVDNGFPVSHLPDIRGEAISWDMISGILDGLTRSSQTTKQHVSNKISYARMRDNLRNRPRRHRRHGGRKGEYLR